MKPSTELWNAQTFGQWNIEILVEQDPSLWYPLSWVLVSQVLCLSDALGLIVELNKKVCVQFLSGFEGGKGRMPGSQWDLNPCPGSCEEVELW